MEFETVSAPTFDPQPPPAFCLDGAGESSEIPSPIASRSVSTAATRVQKVYRSYRTRRRLADSAVIVEELWWQVLDYARLNQSTISFFNYSKPESAVSRWNRISLNASKVGQGLSKDSKAQKLAFQHWIEAIDPRHRYGHNLHKYYEKWCENDAGQPFFYWLDIGDGKNVDLPECPRSLLKQQCIKYLGPQEREHYEYVPIEGKIVHKQTGELLDTADGAKGSKWIFVMSTSKKLYAGQSIWAYSGHYRPSEENLNNFLSFLREHGVDLNEVQVPSSSNEDYYDDPKQDHSDNASEPVPFPEPPQLDLPVKMEKSQTEQPTVVSKADINGEVEEPKGTNRRTLSGGLQSPRANVPQKAILERINSKRKAKSYQLGNQLSLKWCTGAGPRIGCVADYPLELRTQALEIVNLSPRFPPTPQSARHFGSCLSPASVCADGKS